MSLNELREQEVKAQKLYQWFLSAQGKQLASTFALELTGINSLMRGEIFLQLGHCGENPWLDELNYHTKCILSPCFDEKKNTLCASFLELPFAEQSIDALFLPLTLEFFSPKKNPLDEIDRVLKSFGFVIFFGIQPYSIWGLWKRLGKLEQLGFAASDFFSPFYIKRLFVQRGYLSCYRSSFYYLLPVKQEIWLKRLEILNHLNRMMSPWPAGFYCLIMQKHDLRLNFDLDRASILAKNYAPRAWHPACSSLGQNNKL